MGGKVSAEYHRKYYHEKRDKKKVFEQKNARRMLLRKHIWNYLVEHPCIQCGEADPIALEFDHIDPTTKTLEISNTVRDGWAIQNIMKEIAKCQVLCANCHRKKTAKEFGYYSFIT